MSIEQALHSTIANASRLEAVYAAHLLDTPAEDAFDRITKLAARLLAVPVTFIALVDADRDFYKSFFGFDSPLAQERNLKGRTFCHYTIASGATLAIPDTLADPNYHDVPTVTSLGIRAYLGIPLKTIGQQIIGSLCAIDFQPRSWTNEDIECLSELALSATREIDLRIVTAEALRNAGLAQETIRSKEEILAVVAHDLRSPLNVLSIGVAQLAKRHGVKLGAVVELMERANRQMTAMVNDLLDVDSFDSAHLELHKTVMRPEALLSDALTLALPIAQGKRLKLVKVDAGTQSSVSVDYARVLRVFANLIGNAIKFSAEGDEIQLSAQDDGSAVKFIVRDFGEGIAIDRIDRVFERYWQGNRDDSRGVGLGLGIAKSIVEAHGGEIGVESVCGEGSTFWFRLPRLSQGL